MWRYAVCILALFAAGFAAYTRKPGESGTGNRALQAQRAPQSAQPEAAVTLTVSVDYGAQLLLADSQGHKSGYGASTGQALSEIPEASYVNDSISDADDNSSDPAESESRVLEIHPKPGEKYVLQVLPSDRKAYNLEFLCTGPGNSSLAISGHEVPISPGEKHSFVLAGTTACSVQFLRGVFGQKNDSGASLLSYANPGSSDVHLNGGQDFHLVVVYGSEINPASFAATVGEKSISNLFHPAQNSVEAVTIPVAHGRNLVRLSISGKSDKAPVTTSDLFTVDVE